MVSLPDFKKALGPKADKLTEAEIERLYAISSQLANTLFNMWSRKLKTKKVPQVLETNGNY